MHNDGRRVLLIANNDIESSESIGVAKKLKGEFHAFQKLGIDVYFLTFCHDDIVLLHDNEKKVILSCNHKLRYLSNIKFFNIASIICQDNKIDLCYIRFPLSDWAFMRMIKRLHRICKVYIEIPTYPYDEENKKYTNPISRFNFAQDQFFRSQWQKYVNRVVTFSDDREIFGIPCININNGIDVESVKYIGDELKYDSDVTLISVALMRLAHGYDRVIEGLREYYSSGNVNRIVRYNVVGNGPELKHLKEMVENYHLSEYVTFWGTQTGEQLDDIYRNSHIGIGVLAGFREGFDNTSDLKSREYCARGIPMIAVSNDKSFNDFIDFRKMIPRNDDPVSIIELIKYFDYIKNHRDIHARMQKYASVNLSWESQMNKVLRED